MISVDRIFYRLVNNLEEIEVKYDEMTADIRCLEECLYILKSRKDRLIEDLDALKGAWKGPASESFLGMAGKDIGSLEDVLAELDELIQKLTFANEMYMATDNKALLFVRELISQE